MNGLNWNEHEEAVEQTERELCEEVQELIVSGVTESSAIDRTAAAWGWDPDSVAQVFRSWKWGN